LPARKHDLFSVLEQKNEASVIAQSWFFHVAEVDYTTTAGAKEGGVLQPALAVSEGAPNDNLPTGNID
jgi:hypothetical protein